MNNLFKIIFLCGCCLFLCFQSSLAQNSLNVIDANGKKQGYWKKYDDQGKLKYEGTFYNNIPTGKFIYYYPNGTMKTLSIISDSGNVSNIIMYYSNGKVKATGKYLKNIKDGIWKYYNEDEILISEEMLKNGKKESVSQNYYVDGKISEKINWKNGMKDGENQQYFKDGSIKTSLFYKNDVLDGPAVCYYSNGKIMVSGNYNKNLHDGVWMYYTDKGEVEKKLTYKDGDLIEEKIFIQPVSDEKPKVKIEIPQMPE